MLTWLQALSVNEHPFHSHTPPTPVTPFGISWSSQLIPALNWKEGGVRGVQVFYKEQRNILTENRMGRQLQQTQADGRAKKEVNWGEQRQVQCRHCFQISSCEQPWDELLPFPTRQSSSWLAFIPWTWQACGAQGCSSCQPPSMRKFLRGYLAAIRKTLSPEDLSLTTSLHPPRHIQSPARLTDHDKKLWHSSYT